MKFTVLGAGRWGSFITWYLASKKIPVMEWGRPSSEAFKDLIATRKNEYVTLPDSVIFTQDISEAVSFADVIIISIKSQALRSLATLAKQYGADKKQIVLCMKGIEEDTGMRLTEIMEDCGYDRNNLAVWVGPGHIQEFVIAKPNCMVIDGYNSELVGELVDTLKSPLIRFYYGDDIIGSEVGAAAKNVIGIAAGILDGLKLSTLKGALMSRGTREIARLIAAMGGNELSAYGLCHLGDYEATVFSKYSHNRKFGECIVTKEEYTLLAEGYYTVKALVELADKYCVELPICQAVYNILYANANAEEEIGALFQRSIKQEF